MNDPNSNEPLPPSGEVQERRVFLKGIGKWSGAAIMAAVAGSFVGTAPEAQGGWINRRGGGYRGGSWINRGGGGSWVNRRRGRGGSWINRR